MDCLDAFQAYVTKGCTVGLVGVGALGSRMREVAEAMGCQTILCDPPRNYAEAEELSEHFFDLWGNGMGGCQVTNEGLEVLVPLSALVRAEVISVQVPLTDEPPFPTRGLIDASFLASLKPETQVLCFSPVEVVSPEARNDKRIVFFR